jgi:hypothetical protein
VVIWEGVTNHVGKQGVVVIEMVVGGVFCVNVISFNCVEVGPFLMVME